MESYNFARVVKNLYESDIELFSLNILRGLIDVKSENTFFDYLKRLVREGVLIKVERGKYVLKTHRVADFELANFLVVPSYVSFESALNFWGVLSQFPYDVSSATTKKAVVKYFDGKLFSYNHLDRSLFWGYEKKDNFLIAVPEKAFLDQVYLSSKGSKRINYEEIDISRLRVKLLKEYLQRFPKTAQFEKVLLKFDMLQKSL